MAKEIEDSLTFAKGFLSTFKMPHEGLELP